MPAEAVGRLFIDSNIVFDEGLTSLTQILHRVIDLINLTRMSSVTLVSGVYCVLGAKYMHVFLQGQGFSWSSR